MQYALSLSKKYFRQAVPGIYKREKFVNPFLLDAKGHPDGFLSLFSSLRNLRIYRFAGSLRAYCVLQYALSFLCRGGINCSLAFRYAPHQKPPLCKGRCLPERADGGIAAESGNDFALVFGENATSTAQSLSQNRFRRAGFASSLYTREPWGAAAPQQLPDKLQFEIRGDESGGNVG